MLLPLGNPPGLEKTLIGTFTAIAGLRALADSQAERDESDFEDEDIAGWSWALQQIVVAIESAAMPYSRATRKALEDLQANGVPELMLRGPGDLLFGAFSQN